MDIGRAGGNTTRVGLLAAIHSPSFRGVRRTSPESIRPIVVIDSGLSLREPRNDEANGLNRARFHASIRPCSRPSEAGKGGPGGGGYRPRSRGGGCFGGRRCRASISPPSRAPSLPPRPPVGWRACAAPFAFVAR